MQKGLELLQCLGEEAAVQQALHVPQLRRGPLRARTTPQKRPEEREMREGREVEKEEWNCLSGGQCGTVSHCLVTSPITENFGERGNAGRWGKKG